MMQKMSTMGRSHTGGLYNILRFDNLNVAGGRVFKPGEDEDNPWVPVKPLHRLLNDDDCDRICKSQPDKVDQEAPVNVCENDNAGEISEEVTEVPNDRYEKIHPTAR